MRDKLYVGAFIGLFISVVILAGAAYVDWFSKNATIGVSFISQGDTLDHFDVARSIFLYAPVPLPPILQFIVTIFRWTAGILSSVIAVPVIIYSLIDNIKDAISWLVLLIISLFVAPFVLCFGPDSCANPLRESLNLSIASNTNNNEQENASHMDTGYFATIDVSAPEFVKSGESHDIKLILTLSKDAPDNALQVSLQNAPVYTATALINTINFALSPQENRTSKAIIRPEKPVEWNWLLSPIATAEGQQTVAWTVLIDDGSSEIPLELPIVTVKVVVEKRSFLIRSLSHPITQLAMVIIIIPALFIIWGVSTSRNKEEKQRREKLLNWSIETFGHEKHEESDQYLKLYEDIDRLFNLSELHELCFQLNIDYENLPGNTKRDQALELVRYVHRHEIWDELVEKIGELRPNSDYAPDAEISEENDPGE